VGDLGGRGRESDGTYVGKVVMSEEALWKACLIQLDEAAKDGISQHHEESMSDPTNAKRILFAPC